VTEKKYITPGHRASGWKALAKIPPPGCVADSVNALLKLLVTKSGKRIGVKKIG
jgi:hypothetical protein